jgi:hypothetical protein
VLKKILKFLKDWSLGILAAIGLLVFAIFRPGKITWQKDLEDIEDEVNDMPIGDVVNSVNEHLS